MKQTITESLIYWKLAIAKCSGKAMVAGIMSLVATLNGASWSAFTSTEKFVAIAAGIGAMWGVIDAFLDHTIARITERNEKEKEEVQGE